MPSYFFSKYLPLAIATLALWTAPPALALRIEVQNAAGDSVHSEAFIKDFAAAGERMAAEKSAQPLVDLLERYRDPNEVAEIHYSLGLIYGQRTGLVDQDKSVEHFTKALEFQLPERAYLDAMMLRGNAFEQTGDHPSALDDYLRGLLAISYHDLTGGWPREESPSEVWDHRSREAGELEKARDYRLYRERVRAKQHHLRQRYYFIDAVERVEQKAVGEGKAEKLVDLDAELRTRLKRLAPGDEERFDRILRWVRSENEQPWP